MVTMIKMGKINKRNLLIINPPQYIIGQNKNRPFEFSPKDGGPTIKILITSRGYPLDPQLLYTFVAIMATYES